MAKAKKNRTLPPPKITARDREIEEGVTDVENPNWSPDKDGEPGFERFNKNQAINVRESAVETLYARGTLTRLQKKVADLFREQFEVYASESVGALDYSRDQVDASSTPTPVSERRIKARNKLAACRQEIGRRNYMLLVAVCGQGNGLKDIFADNRARTTAADNLRDSLSDTARVWGLVTAIAKRRAKSKLANANRQ